MALRGTLSNFGVADVFCLIGAHNKTGVLQVYSQDEQVVVYLQQGGVVHTVATRRQSGELLGHMLVRAALIDEAQLEGALQRQRACSQRLGEHLLEMQALQKANLDAVLRLQSAETIFRVFSWRLGSYAFDQTAALPGVVHAPVRADSLLMAGVRQADNWPTLRQTLPNYALTFEQAATPDAVAAQGRAAASITDELDFAIDMSRPAAPAAAGAEVPASIGPDEQHIYALVAPGRNVQKLIDLSVLGEFATCQALCNLLRAGAIRPGPPAAATRGAPPALPNAPK